MKQFAENKSINTALKLCSIAAIFCSALIGIAAFKADVRVLLIFTAFLAFYVMIPGVLIISTLGIRSQHTSTDLARSFFTGFALNILLYYLNALTGADVLLLIIGPVLSALCIIKYLRSEPQNTFDRIKAAFREAPASFYIFAALVFLYSMLTTQYTYIAPDSSAFSYIKLDFAYHAGVVNALTDSYPPLDPWVDGLSIQYHFFTEMLMSIPAKLFGLPPEKIILSGTPYLVAPVLSVSLYSFFREFSERRENAGLYCLAFHLSNMFILKQFPNSWFLYHIYSNYDNAGLGIACLLTALPLIRFWDHREDDDGRKRISTKEMFIFAVLVMLMTGIKGPVAIVMIGGIIGTLLLGLILRKIDAGSAAMSLMAVISFVLIYVFVLGSQHSNTSGRSTFNPGEVTDIFFLKEDIMDMFAGSSRMIGLLVLLAVFTVTFFTAFLLPFIIGYIRELILVVSGRRPFVFSKVTVYATCLVGFLGMMLLDFSGHSQVYFGFTCAALVPVIAFWYFEDTGESKTAAAKFVHGFFIVCLCLTAVSLMMYTRIHINSAYRYAQDPDEERKTYQNVSAAEYEGLIWLRDNSDEESLIASDRYFSVDPAEYAGDSRSHNTHFAYAVFSQRRQYIEGSAFSLEADDIELRMEMIRTNKKLYDPENEDRGDLARSLDVDYVVVSKRFNDAGDLENEDYELCFSNEGMDIYEIKEAS